MNEHGGRDTAYRMYLRGRAADYFEIQSSFTIAEIAAYWGLNVTTSMRRRLKEMCLSGWLTVDYRANTDGKGGL